MDIFEAIKTIQTPRVMTWSRSLSQQEIQEYQAEWKQRQEAEKICENYKTYLQFTAREGRAIALAAIELFDVGVEKRFEYLPHIILENLAKLVPSALQRLYSQLINRNLFWDSGIMYWEADPETRDLLFSLLETEQQDSLKRNDLLCALAWIKGEKIQEQFNIWRHIPPAWHTTGSRSMQVYARNTGWELTEEGKRRDLCFQMCYDLLPVDTLSETNPHHPVAVIAPHEDYCPWCDRSLVTIFDLHLRDIRMSFLPFQGERLRIPICINCSLQENVFFDVD